MKNYTASIEKQTFITNDISIEDFDFADLERYEFTSILKTKVLNPEEYGFSEHDEAFVSWANENLSYEELYEVPMMDAVYYYPSFVTFDVEDRSKTASTTTLFYDTLKDAWAVGMTGGGMDLSPHLLDTFISLGKGVPENIALAISKNYSAYIDRKKHLANCKLLAGAFVQKSFQFENRAEQLM